MKIPQTKNGDFVVKYIQSPYDDRYFLCLYNRKEFARIPFYLYQKFGSTIFPDVVLNRFVRTNFNENWYHFLEKVQIYNSHLDTV